MTGGTGVLGRHVVRDLREHGHSARVLSRRPGGGEDWAQGDVATGEGVAAALEDIEAVVHAATGGVVPWRWRKTDVDGTRRLLDLSRRAGVRHFLYVSIVGMEGVPYPYFRFKLECERLVKDSGLPWSILRATQFHSLMERYLRWFALVPGLLLVPYGWQFQPVDQREAAARVAQAAVEPAAGLLPDYGGPEVRRMKQLAESWRLATGSKRRMLRLRLPGALSGAFECGRLLCRDHPEGTVTWERYLERRFGSWSPQKGGKPTP